MTAAPVALPPDTTRQAEGFVYGWLGQRLNRWSGFFIGGFLVFHVLNEATLRISPLPPVLKEIHALDKDRLVQAGLHVVDAVLYSAIAFHSLYGVRLVAFDLGLRLERRYRALFWLILALSVLVGLWQLGGIVGILSG